MTHSRLLLAFLFAMALALAGCNSATTGASACEPVNNWSGPIFACGGGGASASDATSDLELTADDGEDSGDSDSDLESFDDGETDPDSDPDLDEDPAVSASDDLIQTRDPIEFEGNSVSGDSEAVLIEIASFLDSNPDIAVIQVNVYPSSKKKKARKQAKKRAASVKKFLVAEGVSKKRVKTKVHRAPGSDDIEIKIVKRR